MNVKQTSRAGRPRGFSDEELFRATTRVLLEGGIGNLTLKHVASILGYSHQAIAQRFATKEGLLRAYTDWMLVVTTQDVRAILAAGPSYCDAIRRMLTLPVDSRIIDPETIEQQASWTILSLELRREALLGPEIAQRLLAYEKALQAVVAAGQQAGELVAGDPAELAELLLVCATGSATQWLLLQDEPILQKMNRCLDLALGPYLLKP